MPYYLSISVDTSTNLSDKESGKSLFLTSLTKRTRRPEIVQQIHDINSQSSMSNCEEFLQNILIEDLPIEQKESIHSTGRSMKIYGSIQGNIVLAES